MEPTTPAERLLLAAAQAGKRCDLRSPEERADAHWAPSADVAAGWTDDRVVRAVYLRHLLLDQQRPVHLVGTRIDGGLDLRGATINLSLPNCVLTGNALFVRATFTGTAEFAGATFTGAARYGEATFTEAARFGGATFTGAASFGGATFTGITRFDKATFTETAEFPWATFTGTTWFAEATFPEAARFDKATFTGAARFDKATFTGAAWFGRAAFTGDARFDKATFTKTARFAGTTFTGDARFGGATFPGYAEFGGATFIADARFGGATFTEAAWFGRATFTGDARFDKATFTADARFDKATFAADAWFAGTTFTGDAQFAGATFTADARFAGTTFTGDARFAGATFSADARFEGSLWRTLDWSDTIWETSSIVTTGLAAVDIRLDRTIFKQPVQLEVAASRITLKRTRAERLHLVVAGATVSLEDADLAEGSLIEAVPVTVPATPRRRRGGSGGGSWVAIPLRNVQDMSIPDSLRDDLDRLDRDLSAALSHAPSALVTSLQRAHIAGTTLSGMDLRACTFTGADGLDKLVITGDDILTNHRGDKDIMRAWPARGRKWWRTSRRVLHDELRLRDPHPTTTEVADTPTTTTDESSATPTAPLSHRNVSATYRSLRKALEDSKDEPGAADFYYGEMEMRRLASRPISVERCLLTAYWLIAGYGLRAWRSLATLLIVIAVAGWCFTNDAWAAKTVTKAPTSVNLDTGAITSTAPAADGLSLMRSWLFAAQETVALFRPAGLSGVTLTSWGHLIDIAVRILGPVLLALAVLATRNRTKR